MAMPKSIDTPSAHSTTGSMTRHGTRADSDEPHPSHPQSQSRATKSRAHGHSTHAHLHHASAPLSIFNPTRAEGRLSANGDPNADAEGVRWRSRASRKRLYASKIVSVLHDHRRRSITSSAGGGQGTRTDVESGRNDESWMAELRVHQKSQQQHWHGMHFTVVADVSFWVAVIFVLGSVAWVVNGFLLFLPLVSTTSTPHEYEAAAWAFVGGTLFDVGSYLMLVEALNTGHTALFGPSVESLLEGKGNAARDDAEGAKKEKFHWMGTRSWRDLGYLASAIQMFAASIFWVSTLTGLPGVIPRFFATPPTPPIAITDVFFWTPQVIGGTGFVISSCLLMLEEQKRWWMPGVTSVGWHVGLWNLIGAVGFLLCGAFGYGSGSTTWLEYQSVLSTFWGSWAFLIGSLLQLAETLVRE